ncbi:uncharacterized protein SAPINGB_P000196 [Magnusiomyces paraingens]|uniref:C3H1-type domain-containing protein n=1 Tax=Magnusiomyces paraingens TaxID=2606893 RepID=A0A5E8AYQ0_9ASCO|nr:uncharacterized protein SAPINGB_P000196 [Saprochaete ingens]VVT43888.1 unnamed protein product [Saprochaete ingens]
MDPYIYNPPPPPPSSTKKQQQQQQFQHKQSAPPPPLFFSPPKASGQSNVHGLSFNHSYQKPTFSTGPRIGGNGTTPFTKKQKNRRNNNNNNRNQNQNQNQNGENNGNNTRHSYQHQNKPQNQNQSRKRPRTDGDEDEDDYDDEEVAKVTGATSGVRVPGSSPEDIAKWIAERRQRWPTQARVEAKERLLLRIQGERFGVSKESQESASGSSGGAGLTGAVEGAVADLKGTMDNKVGGVGSEGLASESGTGTGTIGTSAAGTSGISMQKQQQQQQQQQHSGKRLCRYFLRKGRCTNGAKCPYLHEVGGGGGGEARGMTSSRNDRFGGQKVYKRYEAAPRMPLFQMMVRGDMQRENEKVLDLVEYLYTRGKL